MVEYHRISPEEARWDRSIDRFRKDLERFYRLGFRPVTASEYLLNRMVLPPGASPVVVTFDDSQPSQIRFLRDGTLDPKSAVGIWKAFSDAHPDFPVKATFYVLPDAMWGQPTLVAKKVQLLRSTGSELGSHTLTHAKLNRLSDKQVEKELGGAIDDLAKLGVKSPVSMALPYGLAPKNRSLLKTFEFEGRPYAMSGAMLVGASPAPAPTSRSFDPYRIPRIQGIEGPMGITYWLDRVQKGNVKPYVE